MECRSTYVVSRSPEGQDPTIQDTVLPKILHEICEDSSLLKHLYHAFLSSHPKATSNLSSNLTKRGKRAIASRVKGSEENKALRCKLDVTISIVVVRVDESLFDQETPETMADKDQGPSRIRYALRASFGQKEVRFVDKARPIATIDHSRVVYIEGYSGIGCSRGEIIPEP